MHGVFGVFGEEGPLLNAWLDFDRGFSVCGSVTGKFNFSTKAADDDDDEAGDLAINSAAW